MSRLQQLLTVGVCVAATVLTRFLPFLLFSSRKPTPAYVRYLGRALPGAIFGMLVVYCLKGVNPMVYSHGLPEALAIALTVILHLWKRQMLLSIAGGTVCYMLLLQYVF